MINYCDIVDMALGQDNSPHRTLRTCLDPGSREWNDTTMEEKMTILKKVAEVESLKLILRLYKKEYQKMNEQYVALSVEDGLTELLNYVLLKD